MAEVAGLTIGVVSLVGVFTSCIDLFSYVSAARSLGEDYRLLNTKLDIEKSLLLLWARRVRLVHLRSGCRGDANESTLSADRSKVAAQHRRSLRKIAYIRHTVLGGIPGGEETNADSMLAWNVTDEEKLLVYADDLRYDRRLDDDLTRDTVAQILVEIQRLLRESTGYLDKFETAPDPLDTAGDAPPILSNGGMEDYTLSLEQLQARFDSLDLHQETKRKFTWRLPIRRKDLNAWDKARWAIRDKGKFERLIHELSGFIKQLDQVVPDTEAQNPRILQDYCELVSKSHKTRGLQMIVEASCEQEDAVAEVADYVLNKWKEKKILDCLWFRFMDDRRNNVDVPHSETLQWVLKPEGQYGRWDSLVSWLQSDADMYWISGKAGSGKSTLMKYLFYHPTTVELLKTWAGESELTVASFFFWRLGTLEQQTLEGLSRALLYNILLADSSIIPHVLPDMWREASDPHERPLSIPSLTEMNKALTVIGDGRTTRMFCFFIDGLDEYSGDYKDGISVLESLSQSPSIKFVVSSRPITPCAIAFSRLPQLCLQELTRFDIANYIKAEVRSHPRMNELLLSNPVEARGILNDLNYKSSGVFLWVVLACRSIVTGFEASDRLVDLRRRVDELPEKLSQMFWLILQRIEPLYRTPAAKLLRLCFEQNALGFGGLHCLGLAMIDEAEMDLAQLEPFRSISRMDSHMKCREFGNRLRSRCWGLLEVHGHAYTAVTVAFLHRSLYEFLSDPEVWKHSTLKIEDENFDASAALCGSTLWMASSFVYKSNIDEGAVVETFLSALRHAAGIRSFSSVGQAILRLQDFFRLLSSRYEVPERLPDGMGWKTKCLLKTIRLVKETSLAGFILSVETGLVNLVEGYVRLHGVDIAKVDKYYPLLYCAFHRPRWGISSICKQVSCEAMIDHLLSARCDPNRVANDGATVWQHWVYEMHCAEPDQASCNFHVTTAFLNAGADIRAAALVLKETLSSRISWLFGVGLSYAAVSNKHVESFGEEAVSCFSKQDHTVISNIGLDLLEVVQQYERAPQLDKQEASAHDYASLQALSDEL